MIIQKFRILRNFRFLTPLVNFRTWRVTTTHKVRKKFGVYWKTQKKGNLCTVFILNFVFFFVFFRTDEEAIRKIFLVLIKLNLSNSFSLSDDIPDHVLSLIAELSIIGKLEFFSILEKLKIKFLSNFCIFWSSVRNSNVRISWEHFPKEIVYSSYEAIFTKSGKKWVQIWQLNENQKIR